MSVGGSLWELGRRAATCLAIALTACLATAGAAYAETTFGGNPDQEVIPEVTEEVSCAPYSCTLFWSGATGTDLAPIPATGGSGTVTSVTLPPMPNPGTMQAVVLTSSVQATHDPAHPTTTCCTVKELSAPFTVPPNQVATVPLALHASATAAADLSEPGDTSTADGVGISVLTPEGSAPLHATENPADITRVWVPALTAPTSEPVTPVGERPDYELEARFTFVESPPGKSPPPTGPGGPGPGADARSGIKLVSGVLRPGFDRRTIVLGRATNPPTASTRQTLTIPARAAAPISGSGARRGAHKPLVIGVGRTTVRAGRSAPLRLTLNARGRSGLVTARTLKATLTIVATNPEGESQTLTRHVTVGPPAKRHH